MTRHVISIDARFVLFDESHKAKNLLGGKGGAPSKVGQAVFELQRLLPNARVVYCSATGVSEPKNMAYMEVRARERVFSRARSCVDSRLEPSRATGATDPTDRLSSSLLSSPLALRSSQQPH